MARIYRFTIQIWLDSAPSDGDGKPSPLSSFWLIEQEFTQLFLPSAGDRVFIAIYDEPCFAATVRRREWDACTDGLRVFCGPERLNEIAKIEKVLDSARENGWDVTLMPAGILPR